MENNFFKQTTYIRCVLPKLSKFVQIAHRPPQIPFTENFVKIKKGLKLVFRPHFSQNFFIGSFLLKYYIN